MVSQEVVLPNLNSYQTTKKSFLSEVRHFDFVEQLNLMTNVQMISIFLQNHYLSSKNMVG